MSSATQHNVSNRLLGQALVLINLLNSYANRCFLVSLSCAPPCKVLASQCLWSAGQHHTYLVTCSRTAGESQGEAQKICGAFSFPHCFPFQFETLLACCQCKFLGSFFFFHL